MPLHCLLICMGSDKKSILIPVCVTVTIKLVFFRLAAFKIVSFSLFFRNLILICFDVGFFMFSYLLCFLGLEVCSFHQICKKKISCNSFRYMFWPLLYLLTFWTPVIRVLYHLMLSYWSQRFCSLFFSFFLFSSLRVRFYYVLTLLPPLLGSFHIFLHTDTSANKILARFILF